VADFTRILFGGSRDDAPVRVAKNTGRSQLPSCGVLTARTCGRVARAPAPFAVSTTWKWLARAETGLAIAVLQLEATPATARRRYMALAA